MKKILAALTVFVFVLTGCGGSADTSDTYIYPTLEVESMDITSSTYSDTFKYLADIFTGLEMTNAKGETVPGIATDTKISDDGLKYTFTLRDDAKWVDNTGTEMAPVTASDFEFAWKEMTADSDYSYIFDPIKNASKVAAGELDRDELGVKAVNDTTLEVELEYVAPYFKSLTSFGAFYPIPQEAFEKYGDDWGQSAETTWYNGAYYPTEYDKSTSIKIAKSELYYDASTVEVPNIEYRTIKDRNLMYNAFEAGEVSWTTFPTQEDLDAAIADGTANEVDTGYMYYLAMNQEEGPTTNINLRKALLYGLNREEISSGNVGQKPVEYFVPEGLTPSGYDGVEYRDYAEKSYVTYDPDKAQEYLQKYMDEEGITDPSQIELTYLSSDSEAAQATATLVQSTYKQSLGITINVDIQPQTSYKEKRAAVDYDLMLGGWGADYADPLSYLGIVDSKNIGSYNPGKYDNPDMDARLKAVAKEQDVDKRFKEMAEIEKQLIDEDVVIIPVYQKQEPYLIKDQFEIGTHLFDKISNRFTTLKEN